MANHIYDEVAKSSAGNAMAVQATTPTRPLYSYLDELQARLNDAHDAVSLLGAHIDPVLSDVDDENGLSPLAPALSLGRSITSRRVEELIEQVCSLESRVRHLAERVDL